MGSTKGFSLIELLIVVAIILIIAAIAIPNLLQARMAANEASAVGSIKALQSAEAIYFNTYPTVGYAGSIANLGGAGPCTPSSTTACLIDNLLATSITGTNGKSGYIFAVTGVMSGGATYNDVYINAGVPVLMNKTGNHDYCSTNDGVLRSQMGSVGDAPVTTQAACVAFAVAQ